MTHMSETTVHEHESRSKEMGKAQMRKTGREAEEKAHHWKEKASETKDRLSEKFSQTFASAREGSKRAVKEVAHRTRDAGNAVYDTAGKNLIPTILIGIGGAWLTGRIICSRSESRGAVSEPAKAEETECISCIKEMTQRAKEGSRHAKEKGKEIVKNNPLYVAGTLTALGSIGLLVGL